MGIPSVGASSSHPVPKEEEEEREREEEENPEGVVTLSDSSNEFEVFNQPLSPESTSADVDYQQQVDIITSNEMGIQRKSQRSLLDLIESQLGKDAPGKSTQPKLPPPPPQSSLPSRPEPAYPKRKREQKGKEVVEAGRSRPVHKDKTQRVAK